MEKTQELFDNWNNEKKRIEFWHSKKIVKIWQIRMSKIWVNIGNEISKDLTFQRPILILKTGIWGDLVTAVPLTSKFNENFKDCLYLLENSEKYGLDSVSYCILNQCKIMSKKRLTRLVNEITVWSIDIPLVPKSIIDTIVEWIKTTIF